MTFYSSPRTLIKTTMTEYMYVSTASTMTKLVECTVSDSLIKICNDTQVRDSLFAQILFNLINNQNYI